MVPKRRSWPVPWLLYGLRGPFRFSSVHRRTLYTAPHAYSTYTYGRCNGSPSRIRQIRADSTFDCLQSGYNDMSLCKRRDLHWGPGVTVRSTPRGLGILAREILSITVPPLWLIPCSCIIGVDCQDHTNVPWRPALLSGSVVPSAAWMHMDSGSHIVWRTMRCLHALCYSARDSGRSGKSGRSARIVRIARMANPLGATQGRGLALWA